MDPVRAAAASCASAGRRCRLTYLNTPPADDRWRVDNGATVTAAGRRPATDERPQTLSTVDRHPQAVPTDGSRPAADRPTDGDEWPDGEDLLRLAVGGRSTERLGTTGIGD